MTESNDQHEQEADQMAEKVMRMPGTDSQDHATGDTKANPPVANYISSLHSTGRPLPESSRHFFEPRFGTDLSGIRIHDDQDAAQSARSIHALAYTRGKDIVFGDQQFAPETDSGKKLIAHELTHVLQQDKSQDGLLQRQKTPETALKAQEADLRKQFLDIGKEADKTAPDDVSGKKKIQEMVKKFLAGFKNYTPAYPSRQSDYFMPIDEYWRHEKIYSLEEANDLSARLQVITLFTEANQLYKLGKPSFTTGVFPLDQPDQFYTAFTSSVIKRVNTDTPVKTAASLDLLLNAYTQLVNRITQLDTKKLEQYMKFHTGLIPVDFDLAKSGFQDEYTFFSAMKFHMAEIITEIQKIVQKKMDVIFQELKSSGESPSLPETNNMLIKIATATQKETVFTSKGKDKINFSPSTATEVPVTKSSFTNKGGTHKDFFDPKHGPTVDFDFYGIDKEGKEKSLSIFLINQTRIEQIKFIKSFYGLDDKGKKITGKEGPQDFMTGKKQFDLFSLDDWREFVKNKFENLTGVQKKNEADAFLTVANLISYYMKVFTIHSPFDIEDFGDNYLKHHFPRALTGQLIHDCGVYALRTLYLLSTLGSKLKLKFQYILLPNHIGLIIRGDQIPVVMVQNDDFKFIPLSENQFDSLGKENQQSVLGEKSLQDYQKAQAAGDTSKFDFTLDKSVKNIKSERQVEQFLGEYAGNQFVPQTDIPFEIRDINAKDYNNKLSLNKIKSNLWAGYEKMNKGTELFSPKAVKDKSSPDFQFNLRYLKLTEAEKKFHNERWVILWNTILIPNWIALSKQLKLHAKDKNGYIAALQDYHDNKLIPEQKKNTELRIPIKAEKDSIHEAITTHSPNPLNKSARKAIGQDAWPSLTKDLDEHIILVEKRIANLKNKSETPDSGTDITPPFDSPEHRQFFVP